MKLIKEAKTILEDTSKDWNDIFARFLDIIEFSLEKHEGDDRVSTNEYGEESEGTWSLVDNQGGNLGDIEGDRFNSADEIIDRLDVYINDYFLNDEEWGEFDSVEQALKEKPDHPEKDILELIAYHGGDVDLNKVYELMGGDHDVTHNSWYIPSVKKANGDDSNLYIHGKTLALHCDEKTARRYIDSMNSGSTTKFNMYRVSSLIPSSDYYVLEPDEIEDEIVDNELRNKSYAFEDMVREKENEIRKWLGEHDQAYKDAIAHFGVDDLDDVSIWDIIDFIEYHDTLNYDFRRRFGLSTSMEESVSIKEAKENKIVLTRAQKEMVACDVDDDFGKDIDKEWVITYDKSADPVRSDSDDKEYPAVLLIDGKFADALTQRFVDKITSLKEDVDEQKHLEDMIAYYTKYAETSKEEDKTFFKDFVEYLKKKLDKLKNGGGSLKESKQLNEGTGNFSTQDGLPIFAWIDEEEAYYMMKDEWKESHEDFDDEEDEEEAFYKFEEEYYNNLYAKGYAIEDYRYIEGHLDEFNDFVRSIYNKYYDESEEAYYEAREAEDDESISDEDLQAMYDKADELDAVASSLGDLKLGIEPGYYQGAQLYLYGWDDLSDEVPEEVVDQIYNKYIEFGKKLGLMQLGIAYRFSNGETGYNIIKESKKLTERRWDAVIKAGIELRNALSADKTDVERVRKAIIACYDELYDKGLIDDYDHDVWTEEVRDCDFESEWGIDEDAIDYELDELYDLCDNIGAFLAVTEADIDESLKEGWYHFEYESGANPYIAKNEKERDRIIKKYQDRIENLGGGKYLIHDKEEDLFSLKEDTVKQGNNWVNKGKEGTHGKFKTKKAADAQRKAMFANSGKNRNFGENLKEGFEDEYNNVFVEFIDGTPTFAYDSLKDAMRGLAYDEMAKPDSDYTIMQLIDKKYIPVKGWAPVKSLKEGYFDTDFNSKKVRNEIVGWWDDVERWNEENGSPYSIDNGDTTNLTAEDVEDMLAAMFDMLRELKDVDKDLYKKGRRIYNKYAITQLREAKNLKESHLPTFSEFEEWCMGNTDEMLATLKRMREGNMNDGDRRVFNDFGFDELSEEELNKALDKLEAQVESRIADESLKESKEVFVVTTDGNDIKSFDKQEDAIKFAQDNNCQQVEKKIDIADDDYEVVWSVDALKESIEEISDTEIFDILGIEEANRDGAKGLLPQFRELAKDFDKNSIWLKADHPTYTDGNKVVKETDDLVVVEALTESKDEPVEEKKETAKDRVLAKRAMKEAACKEPENKPEGNWAWDKDACDWYDKDTDTFHSETIKEEVVEESIDPETYVEDMEGFDDIDFLEESIFDAPIITDLFGDYDC